MSINRKPDPVWAQSIHIAKEALKFSAAHMTVFPDGTKERLHGHNYTTKVTLELPRTHKMGALDGMIPFDQIKLHMRDLCDAWDERILVPARCPFLLVKRTDEIEVEFLLCNQRYILPSSDVAWIQTENTSVEALSAEFCRLLIERIGILSKKILSIQITIYESPGQGSTFKQIIESTT